ncbi:MAG: J domain-containing protein [Scytonematopsis contorta HA4267-MV1]|jgi:curved DNA-binding protein CbpA|nr:J domain-containing protein [Scytonematopsis contorta HA4267-MV1]
MRERPDVYHAYSILGLSIGASQDEIKQAYRDLVKIWHPDRFTDVEQKLQAEEKIKQINAAYEKLKSIEVDSSIKSDPVPEPVTEPSRKEPSNPGNSTKQANPEPFRTKISSRPNNPETFYNFGVEKIKLGEYEEAIAHFTRAIRLKPDYIEAYKSRGFACSVLGYENRAASDLNKAAQMERELKKNSGEGYSTRKSSARAKQKTKGVTSLLKGILGRLCRILKSVLMLNQK